jgi:hypothetical protein
VGDMTGRNGATKDAAFVERVVANTARFDGHAFVMTALETHDARRLTDGTGFTPWTGAGFWGIGATTRSTPMILMGQELGEGWGLGFKRSDYLRARFVGSATYRADADALASYYKTMIDARLARENRALLAPGHAFLRSRWTGAADARIFAQVKWSDDANVVFTMHNLWEADVEDSFFLEPWVADAIHLDRGRRYRLVDALSGTTLGACRSGADLAYDFYVKMGKGTRAQWARLETCP